MGTLAPPELDEAALCQQRLAHLRAHMDAASIGLCLITNPVNIRYATGYRGYATFQSRIPSQYLLVPVSGPVVLHGAYTDDLPTIDRCDVAHSITGFDAGLDLATAAERFVTDVEVALCDANMVASSTRIGMERTTPSGFDALKAAGLSVIDAEPTIELARSRKLPDELPAMRYAIAVAEHGMATMHAALRPGVSENELFALLHQVNISHDGDWIDGRMLCSGPRTNPWYQEASARRIQPDELVAFDTDMVGPFGYCADISRTWLCGETPSTAQRDLHQRALAEIEHNTALLHVGASFAELSQATFRHPDRFIANRYACAFHGVGMSDEYPKIPYPDDWDWTGYDGEIEDGTVLSVESYVGAGDGEQGVKLEQMVQVSVDGVRELSHFPIGLTINGPS